MNSSNEQFGDVRIRVDANNDIEINLEDAARGLGFTKTEEKVSTTSGRKPLITARTYERFSKIKIDLEFQAHADDSNAQSISEMSYRYEVLIRRKW